MDRIGILASVLAVACKDEPRALVPDRPRDAGHVRAAMREARPPQAPSAPDPAPLDRVLAAHVRAGLFDYAAMKADDAGIADLDAYLSAVAGGASPDLATLIDAYDAIVLREITHRYPIRSVMDVPGFFDRLRHPVGGREVSLNELEKEWILPTFLDVRVHFALNCGARSCPALPTSAFRAKTLDSALDACVQSALARPDFLRVDAGAIRVTRLFEWYRADFGDVGAFVRRYRPEVPADARIAFGTYDWRLNDAR